MNQHLDLIERFRDLRVTVVGDVMLDRYVAGRVRRISPEAPVPVLEVSRTYDRAGGAANVAMNVRQLGARTTLIGVVGDDADGERLRQILSAAGVVSDTLVTCPRQATTVKTRIVAQRQQIVRVDRDIDRALSAESTSAIARAFVERCASDVVILSDYAKGVLTTEVCRNVLEHARARGIPAVVDPKGKDYQRYVGATTVTPNQAEAAQAIGRDAVDDDSFEELARFFLRDLAMSSALITLGERGMCLLLPNRSPMLLPATARDVADVTGAGDTAVGVFALGLGAGLGFESAARAANVAAGLVVGKAGTASISRDELRGALLASQGHRDRPPRRSPVPRRKVRPVPDGVIG